MPAVRCPDFEIEPLRAPGTPGESGVKSTTGEHGWTRTINRRRTRTGKRRDHRQGTKNRESGELTTKAQRHQESGINQPQTNLSRPGGRNQTWAITRQDNCHCEESDDAAISVRASDFLRRDCFASLAMTTCCALVAGTEGSSRKR